MIRAIAAVGVPLIVLLCTMQGGIAYWDTGEMQVVPWIFGIPHPTGFPAFVLFAGIFAHVVPFGAVSWRVTLFCTLLLAGSVALVYFTISRCTANRFIAAACAWVLAFNPIMWIYGDRAEVHTMAAFFGTAAICCFLLGYRERHPRYFQAGSISFGLGLATHPLILFLLPALFVMMFASRRIIKARSLLQCLGLALCPLLLYSYLPIRSHIVVAQHLDPAAALGKPLGGAFWNTDNPQTFSGLRKLVTGTEFEAGGSALHAVDLLATVSAAPRFLAMMARAFTFPGLAIVVICLGVLAYRAPLVAAALVLAVVMPASFALTYAAVVEPERYFFLPIVSACLIAGLGVGVLELPLQKLLVVPLYALAAFLAITTFGTARVYSNYNAQPEIDAVLKATNPHSIVITSWTYAAPLAYAAYVQHSMGARSFDVAWPFQDAPYLRTWLASGKVYYVGQRIGGEGIVLCRLTARTPIFEVFLKPAHC